jgi:thermospermine synthase
MKKLLNFQKNIYLNGSKFYKFLKKKSDGAFNDKRFKLIINDCKKFLEENETKYDIIIMDLCDPVENGPAYQLYTKEFYQTIQKRLNKNGIFVTQSCNSGLLSHKDIFSPIFNTVKQVFKNVFTGNVFIPSFIDTYGFSYGTDNLKVNLKNIKNFDELIKKRLNSKLKYLDDETLKSALLLPKIIRETLNNEKRIIEKDNYIFMH